MQSQLHKYHEQCIAHDREYAKLKSEWDNEDEHTQAESLAYLCDMVALLNERHACLSNVVTEHMHVFHNVPRENYASSTQTHIG